MEYRPLGQTGLKVSALCLGTMTFGDQNSEAQAHEQIDRALAAGINFLDAAEMYPVPPKADTQGRTEQYIGSWLARSGRRDDIILASKVTGRSQMEWTRDPAEPTRLSRAQIHQAVDASLRRLQTDYLDLYQVHWPDRKTNTFGALGYTHQPHDDEIDIAETLSALGELVTAGKVRHVGVSNETPWGVMQYLRAAEQHGLPRIASIQNPYSLINRSFEVGLAEFAEREQVGLLAYSPMAFGVLSGKYLGGQQPEGARLTLWKRFDRYSKPEAEVATRAYVELAQEFGLSPAQMALAFVTSRSFVTSNIIGATTLEQLDENMASADIRLPEALLERIDAIHQQQPNPAP